MTVVALLPVHFLKLKYLVHSTDALSLWEWHFISGILGRKKLTQKQIDKLNQIYDGVRHGLYFSGDREVTEAWNDVHDFDRV